MHTLPRIALVGLAAGMLLLPAKVAAQDVAPPGFGLGISGAALSISPEENKRVWGGMGSAFLRYTWSSGIQVVGGAGYGAVDAGEVGTLSVSGTRKLLTVFGEARLVLNTNARTAAPYVGAHVAYLDHDLDTTYADAPLKVSGTGWNYAGVFGVVLRLANSLAVDFSGKFGVAPFGDPDATYDGEALD
ncbi:MAG: outer membrane beta-barrel protein, partial [Gemmatimonadales bacterium]